jgi:poly-gamma-glutamate capsule biosynthesis protein CapA/YwtB (metallophosphatase superfamily)
MFPRYHPLILFILLFCVACQPVSAAYTPLPEVGSSPAAAIPTRTPLPSGTATPLPTATFVPPTLAPSATPIFTATPTGTPTMLPITTLLFTGVIVPARCVQAALDANGNPDYPYDEVRSIIQQADIAIGTYNSTMSDRAEHTGCVDTYQLVGSPQNADAAARAGFDVMSVATNHIKDCGLMKGWCNETFFDTLDNLHRVGILTVGAGKNLAEALQPVVITVNGVRFGIVSLGDSKQDESVFAGEDFPGIAHLDEENLKTSVALARQAADVVIVMPHWGSEDIILPNGIQRNQANMIVSLGADLVVGNHTHVVQAIQEISGVTVFYGLGNFIFDQGLRDHRQGVILLVRFQGTQYLGYELIPTYHERNGRVHLASKQEGAEILQRIKDASDQLK